MKSFISSRVINLKFLEIREPQVNKIRVNKQYQKK